MSQLTLRRRSAYRRRRRSPRRSYCRSRRRTPWPTGLRTRPSTSSRPGCRGTSTETARGPAPPPRQQLPPLRKCGCAMAATQTTYKYTTKRRQNNRDEMKNSCGTQREVEKGRSAADFQSASLVEVNRCGAAEQLASFACGPRTISNNSDTNKQPRAART